MRVWMSGKSWIFDVLKEKVCLNGCPERHTDGGADVHLCITAMLTTGVTKPTGATHPADAHHLTWTRTVYRGRAPTSLRSCRHSSTARLLVQVCLGQRRVRSSRQASSSDSFQPVALRGCEAPAAAAAGASFAGGSAGLRTGGLWSSAGPLAAFKPRTEPKLQRHTDDNSSSSWARLYAAIFTALSS